MKRRALWEQYGLLILSVATAAAFIKIWENVTGVETDAALFIAVAALLRTYAWKEDK